EAHAGTPGWRRPAHRLQVRAPRPRPADGPRLLGPCRSQPRRERAARDTGTGPARERHGDHRQDQALRPRGRQEAPLGGAQAGRRPEREGPRRPQRHQVGAYRQPGVPALVRPRHLRFGREVAKKRRWEQHKLGVVPNERVLDVLNDIKWDRTGSRAFRRSCAHGICGSDAMLINGRNRLACKVLVKDLGTRITVEPLPGLPVLKDLIVDMEPFFDAYKAVLPYFINEETPPATERLQSPEDRELFDATTKC